MTSENIRTIYPETPACWPSPSGDRNNEPMTFELRAREIRKSFGGVEVLHGVDLDAVGGSVLALLGENGAGKSTLVKIIAGDYQADGGAVEVDGVGLSHAHATPGARPGRGHHLPGVPGRVDPDGRGEHLSRTSAKPRGLVVLAHCQGRARKILDQPRWRSTRRPSWAACASVSDRSWRSPGHCPARRGCSSLMSRRPHSPTMRRNPCLVSCAACATRVSPSSTSPIAWTR